MSKTGKAKMAGDGRHGARLIVKDSAASESSPMIIQPKEFQVCVEVAGTQPLIMHRFGQKALEQMLRKHMGLSVAREAKKPRELIDDAIQLNTAGATCVPVAAFKGGMLDAAPDVRIMKTRLRGWLFVFGGSVPIKFSSMTPRMDMVRTSGIGRTPDVRFRPQFNDWTARLLIQFVDTIQVNTVLDLLQRAGRYGIGEWRPQKGTGTFGTYHVSRIVEDKREIEEVKRECAPPLVMPVIPEWAMDVELPPEALRRIASGDAIEADGADELAEAEA